jgi:hypothetical protein
MCTDAYRAALIQDFLARESAAPSPRGATEPRRVDSDRVVEPKEAVSR